MRLVSALIVLFAATFAGAAPAAEPSAVPAPSATECHAISRADFDKAFAEAKTKPGAKVSNYKFVTRVLYADGNTADFFTRHNNKAHPAYVRRSVAINGSDISIDTQGYTAGAAPVCTRWLKGFMSQNSKIKAAIAKAPQ
jgi:hypothetical protein